MQIMENRELLPVAQENAPLTYEAASKAVATVLARKLEGIKAKAGDSYTHKYATRSWDGDKEWNVVKIPSLEQLNPYNSQSVMQFLRSGNDALAIAYQEDEVEVAGLLNAYKSLPERYGEVLISRGYHSFVINCEVPHGDLIMMPDLGRYEDTDSLMTTEDILPVGSDATLGFRTLKRMVGGRSMRKKIAATTTAVKALSETVLDPNGRAMRVDTGVRDITDNTGYSKVWTNNPGDVIRDALRNCINPDHLWFDELREQVIWLAKLSDVRDDLNEKWTMARKRQDMTGNSEQERMDQWRVECLQIEEMMRSTLYIIKSKTKTRQQQAKLDAFSGQLDDMLGGFVEMPDAEINNPQHQLLSYFRHAVADTLRSVENLEPKHEEMFKAAMGYVSKTSTAVSEPGHVQAVYQGFCDKFSDSMPIPSWDEFYESFQKNQTSLS